MSIPSFDAFMLPVLVAANDGEAHDMTDLRERVRQSMGLSEDDLAERVPSGRKTRFDDRTGWSVTYLKQAELLESVRRGEVRITPSGKRLLAERPARIDVALLRRLSDHFREFHSRRPQNVASPSVSAEQPSETETPEELLAAGAAAHRQATSAELIARLKTASPAFLETVVVDLLTRLGYGGVSGEGVHLGKTADGGVDGVIRGDKLGLDEVYVQAKRWENTVGAPEVQQFAGALSGMRATRGVFITTSAFSPAAKSYVTRIDKRIALVDGEMLGNLMLEVGLGVTARETYIVWGVDSDYFEGE
ncbi:restriction endonuclease [bacterium]|nr:restriction endonuclease [bacterium]